MLKKHSKSRNNKNQNSPKYKPNAADSLISIDIHFFIYFTFLLILKCCFQQHNCMICIFIITLLDGFQKQNNKPVQRASLDFGIL